MGAVALGPQSSTEALEYPKCSIDNCIWWLTSSSKGKRFISSGWGEKQPHLLHQMLIYTGFAIL